MAGIIPPSVPGLGADKVRAARVTTGSVAGLGEATVTVTWASAFADTNYTVTASVLHSPAGVSSGLRLVRIRTQTAAAITVLVANDAATAQTGTLNAIAIHD